MRREAPRKLTKGRREAPLHKTQGKWGGDPPQVAVSVPAIFKGGTIADQCKKASRPKPPSNTVGNTS